MDQMHQCSIRQKQALLGMFQHFYTRFHSVQKLLQVNENLF